MSEDTSLVEKTTTPLSAESLSNLEAMEKIANNEQTIDDIRLLTSSKITDQLKVFLIAQARNELSRVLKLTKFLDRVEDSFMDKVNEGMDANELTLKQYSDILEVITSLLSRSNEIINNVLGDDSLTTILNTTVYATEYGQSTSVVTNLRDAQSRERVRKIIQQILNKTSEYTTPDTYVDVPEAEISNDKGDDNNE